MVSWIGIRGQFDAGSNLLPPPARDVAKSAMQRLLSSELSRRTSTIGHEQPFVVHFANDCNQPLLDRVARQARALRDLAEGELVAQLHAPDLANHVHGDHLVFPC